MPFQPPRLRVNSQVLDAITPHTPVSTVQLSYPVTTLLNCRFRDAPNSCTKAELVVIPVGLCAPRSATVVSVRKGSYLARSISDSADGGKGQRSREAIVRQPFTSL